MRKLPFESATFDAAVSSYAIDHLGREGARQALAEAARVVKPGGNFLMTIAADDAWTRVRVRSDAHSQHAGSDMVESALRGGRLRDSRRRHASDETLLAGAAKVASY